MNHKKTLIHGGSIVSETGVIKADLLIEGERIKAQGVPAAFKNESVDEVLDVNEKLLLPGLIDPHVHFNSPFMGSKTIHDYYNGTIAAAYGGITTIIDFSTQPKGGSLIENLSQKEDEANGKAFIDWSLHGILLDANPETLSEIPKLITLGIPTYKCFTTYRHADRMMDDEGILKVLELTAENGGMLMVHCENDTILEYHLNKALSSRHFSPIYHARSRPPSAENEAIRRVIVLMNEVPATVYIVHTTTADSVNIIQDAREKGLPIHSETCTHYLTLTEESLDRENGHFYICSPPFRTQKDIDVLWRAVADGRIEVISSDDAGMPSQERVQNGEIRFDKVTNGMPGIEPRLIISYTAGVCKNKIDLPRLVSVTSTTPARLFGLYPQKGHLGPGADADVVIFDPKKEWTMNARNLHMNDSFCPFEDWKVQGFVETVFSRGKQVIKEGRLVGTPGHGRRVFRKLSS